MSALTPSITIRLASITDQGRVGGLWSAFLEEQHAMDARLQPSEDARQRWDNDYPVWLKESTRRISVAVVDRDIVGFVTANLWSPPPVYTFVKEVLLSELYVIPRMRAQGIGTKLVADIKAWGVECGAEQMRLIMLNANATGQGFWEKNGSRWFSREGIIQLEGSVANQKSQPRRARLGF